VNADAYARELRKVVRNHKAVEESQWWPAERLRDWQLRRRARLVANARQHVPYYAELLRGLRLDGELLADEQWRSIPLLTKAILREQQAQLRSTLDADHENTQQRATTGSTARPLSIVKDVRPRRALWAIKLRGFTWFATDYSGTQVDLHALRAVDSPGTVQHFADWGRPLAELFRTGRRVRADVYMPIEKQIDLLEAEQANYLRTYASNLHLLLRELRRSGRRLPALRYVQTQGDQLDPGLHDECREVLGAPLWDIYGCAEADWVAVQCPQYRHYHVQSELNLVEVLDAQGRPCKPGELGRIVITPLHLVAMPLLRYDVGDYAEVGEPCPCGRGLPVLKRIAGRDRAMLTLPSGEKRVSPFGQRIFARLPAVQQYQIAQTRLSAVEVRFVADRPLTDAERAGILQGFGNQLGAGFDLTLREVDALPRGPGGKFMEFVSEL
jgi:phenylacetate-CoA ligase